MNDFAVVFISIVLQSLPFVLVGVLASALVQQILRDDIAARWMPRRDVPAIVLSSLLGLVAPVCDCGATPLARRLIARGVPVYAGVTFLLAAPVVNPIALLATALAFQGNIGVVALRAVMTLSTAMTIGLVVARLFRSAALSLPTLTEPLGDDDKQSATAPSAWIRFANLLSHVVAEYFDVMFFIVLGALFSAASQTLITRGDLLAVGAQRAGSVLALMPLGSILSICSEADAFVARAFANSFSFGAVMAFMTIGQIVDLRNGFLLWRTLGARLFVLIVLIAYPLVFAEGVLVNHVMAGA